MFDTFNKFSIFTLIVMARDLGCEKNVVRFNNYNGENILGYKVISLAGKYSIKIFDTYKEALIYAITACINKKEVGSES